MQENDPPHQIAPHPLGGNAADDAVQATSAFGSLVLSSAHDAIQQQDVGASSGAAPASASLPRAESAAGGFAATARALIAQHVGPAEAGAPRLGRRASRLSRDLTIRPPRPLSYSPALRLRHVSRSRSASTSPTSGEIADMSPIGASYSVVHWPVTPSESNARAAVRIQRAWRTYRTLSSRSFCELGEDAVQLVQRFLSGECFVERPASAAHLTLHFDVNKTILCSDAVKGADQADMINMLLSECAWGRMTLGPEWLPVGRLATDLPEGDPELMTFRNFLDSFKYPFVSSATDAGMAENARRKRLCSELQRTFTHPGNPGAMFSGVAAALAVALTQPPVPAGRDPTGFFAAGQRRILPSFFELLLHLHRTGRRFTVVFRTFGSDVIDVIEEMNMFATGSHPSYPGVRLDGSDGRTDLRLEVPASTGAFARWGHGAADTALAVGVDGRVLTAPRITRKLLEEVATERGGAVAEGFDAIFDALGALSEPYTPALHGSRAAAAARKSGDGEEVDPRLDLAAPGTAKAWLRRRRRCPNTALALRDNWHFWRSRNERPRAGKLLLCDPRNPDVAHIFFDDNIGHSSAHIADARDMSANGESMAFQLAKNAHLIRAEPVNAILDPMYFVRSVAEAELAIRRRLEADSRPPWAALRLPGAAAPPPTAFTGDAMLGLHRAGKSGVARVSLRAKQHWEWALRKVLVMCRVVRAFADGAG